MSDRTTDTRERGPVETEFRRILRGAWTAGGGQGAAVHLLARELDFQREALDKLFDAPCTGAADRLRCADAKPCTACWYRARRDGVFAAPQPEGAPA